jgi:DNA-binding transcriptional MocR family regulator
MYDLTGVTAPWPGELLPVWADALAGAGRSAGVWRTPKERGEPELLDVLGELLGADPGRITVVTGVRAAAVVLGRCRGVAHVERPTFAEIPRLLAHAGAQTRLCGRRTLVAELRRTPAEALAWVTSPARNPDGASLDPVTLAGLVEASASGAIVVCNETYRWFAGESTAESTGLVRVGSFAKLVGGGVRLGWVVDPPAEARLALPMLAPPTQWQRAWARFLRQVSCPRIVDAFVEPVRRARTAFAEAAGRPVRELLTGTGPSVLLPLGATGEREAQALLSARGVRTGRGADFFSPYPALRLSFTGSTWADAADAGRIVRDVCAEHPALLRVPAESSTVLGG